MQCLIILSSAIKSRLDPIYHKNIHSVNSINQKFPLVTISSLLKDEPQYGANERAIDGNPSSDTRYIRITDIDDFGDLKNNEWKTAKKIDHRYMLEENDILFARSGATAGKTFIFKKKFRKAIFAGYLIRFKIDENKIDPEYVFYYTLLRRYSIWLSAIQRPSGQPNINAKEFESFTIPLPSSKIQTHIVNIIKSSHDEKKQKMQQANNLLNSFSDLLFQHARLKLPIIEKRKIFVKNIKDLEGTLNPERYSDVFNLDRSFKWINIVDIGDVNKQKFKIEKMNLNQDFSHIRIDDLENNPLSASVRDVKGKDVKGSVFNVNENDVLLARLSPTIENKKFILCPSSKKPILASPEFLCLRCNKSNNPIFVIAMLKTDFYKKIMIEKSRGATPSRRRLSAEDFEKLPFPVVDIKIQNKISDVYIARIEEARTMRKKGHDIVKDAEKSVEKILDGQTKSI